jgi:hypothetical protein
MITCPDRADPHQSGRATHADRHSDRCTHARSRSRSRSDGTHNCTRLPASQRPPMELRCSIPSPRPDGSWLCRAAATQHCAFARLVVTGARPAAETVSRPRGRQLSPARSRWVGFSFSLGGFDRPAGWLQANSSTYSYS